MLRGPNIPENLRPVVQHTASRDGWAWLNTSKCNHYVVSTQFYVEFVVVACPARTPPNIHNLDNRS